MRKNNETNNSPNDRNQKLTDDEFIQENKEPT